MGQYAEYEIEYSEYNCKPEYIKSGNKIVKGIINKFKLHKITDNNEMIKIMKEFLSNYSKYSKNNLKNSFRYLCFYTETHFKDFHLYLSKKYPK